MIIPIGNAVLLPAIPTKGAKTAPKMKLNSPNNAEALPAECPYFSIAKAVPDDPTIPRLDTTKNKGGKIPGSPAPKRIAVNKLVPPRDARMIPLTNNFTALIRLANRPVICPARIIPRPLIAKNKLNN